MLARQYELQVKKVIKVQSMMRALLARKRVKGGKVFKCKSESVKF